MNERWTVEELTRVKTMARLFGLTAISFGTNEFPFTVSVFWELKNDKVWVHNKNQPTHGIAALAREIQEFTSELQFYRHKYETWSREIQAINDSYGKSA